MVAALSMAAADGEGPLHNQTVVGSYYGIPQRNITVDFYKSFMVQHTKQNLNLLKFKNISYTRAKMTINKAKLQDCC